MSEFSAGFGIDLSKIPIFKSPVKAKKSDSNSVLIFPVPKNTTPDKPFKN